MRGSDYYLTTVGSKIMDRLKGVDEIVLIKIVLDDSTPFSTREQNHADSLERATLIGRIKDL